MRHGPTQQEIEFYQENGYLVVEDFLDSQELEDWRLNVKEAIDDRLQAPKPKEGDPWLINTTENSANDYYANVFLQCIKLADTHEGMRRIMLDPALGEFAASLAQIDGIRIWHDQALIKPPFGNPTGWHLDNPYWSFFDKRSLSIWVALDDATLGNGCMWYVPGSHKTARFENVSIGQNMGDLFNVFPEWKEITPVACPCHAGSAVFHSGIVAHGAGANMTNKPRRAMTCAYMPDGATFNGQQNVLPKDYFDTLQIGDVLNDDKMNPLVWRKSGV